MADSLISGVSNTDLFSGIGGIASGVGSLFSGLGQADVLNQQADAYTQAAGFATENAFLAGEVGGLKELAVQRQVQHVQGQQAAYAAANGLKVAGSSLSMIRDTAQQGALAQGIVNIQTGIDVTGFQAQAAADKGAAQAAQTAASNATTGGIFGFLGGALKAVPLIGSLF